MGIPVSHLPMDTAEFGRTLNIGLGRPILHLQQHNASLYRDAILYACLNITSYDPQCEGSRADYLREVLQLTGEPEFYRQPILDALAATPIIGNYLEEQLLELALKNAKQGDLQAGEIIRQKFVESVVAVQTAPASIMLMLDGLDGLVSVVTQWLQAGSEAFDDWDFDVIIREALEKFGVIETRFALRTAAQTNEPLMLLLNRLPLVRDIKLQNTPANENSIAEAVKAGNHLPRGWKEWFTQAPDEVVHRFAADLLCETEPRPLLLLLRLFDHRAFPLDHQKLFQLAEYGDDRLSGDQVAIAAINALSHISHPDVRGLALKMIAEHNRSERAVELLKNNFEAEDWQLIIELAYHLRPDTHAYHSLGFAVRDIFKAHPSEDARAVFTHFYEYGACSLCRKRNVEVLLELEALPEWMLEECQYDANSDLRKKARFGFTTLDNDET